MNILILNGSPRARSNSAAFAKAFKEGAESAGHSAEILDVGKKKINGCMACEYCHKAGNGQCIQKDDMHEIYPKLAEADVLVLASPIHYWSFSGQLQSLISRFYAIWKPAAKKYAMILSSGSPAVYDAPISQYKSILSFFGAEDLGIKTFCGRESQATEENIAEISAFGASIK